MKLNPNSQKLFLVDSRPVANALANAVMGRGLENTDLYVGCQIKFLGIGNIRNEFYSAVILALLLCSD